MIQQQVFECPSLGGLHLGGIGDDDSAIFDGSLAAGDDLGNHGDGSIRLFVANFHQAHTATGDN